MSEFTKRIETELAGLDLVLHYTLDSETAEPYTFRIDFESGGTCRTGHSLHRTQSSIPSGDAGVLPIYGLNKRIFSEMDWLLAEEFQDELIMESIRLAADWADEAEIARGEQ